MRPQKGGRSSCFCKAKLMCSRVTVAMTPPATVIVTVDLAVVTQDLTTIDFKLYSLFLNINTLWTRKVNTRMLPVFSKQDSSLKSSSRSAAAVHPVKKPKTLIMHCPKNPN